MPELLRDGRARFGLAVLIVVVSIAVLAPFVSGRDPAAQGDIVATRFLTPFSTDPAGSFHLLGTDRLGRDVWTRLAHGARISLIVGVLATLLALTVGITIGTVAAVAGGPLRLGLLAVTDFALALPRVVLLLLLAALWRPGGTLVVVVLGLTGWMSVARLVYGESSALLARPFASAAIALGASRRRIILRHLLPNTMTPIIVAAALGIGNAITLEAGLSFLGLGVQPPAPSWGGMISSGRDSIVNAPWVALAPGVALVLVVLACMLLGDAIRDRVARRAEMVT
ncbi:MAG: ABC transporter permease [Gemmatimonadales bacterium]